MTYNSAQNQRQRIPEPPSMTILPALGPTVCKSYLPWAVWRPGVCWQYRRRKTCGSSPEPRSLVGNYLEAAAPSEEMVDIPESWAFGLNKVAPSFTNVARNMSYAQNS